MGIGAQTLPFDWVRVSLPGVLEALARDFDGFLHYGELAHHDFATPSGEVFVAKEWSFWHDDLRLQEVRDKYARRIARFRGLLRTAGQRGVPVIFARSVASTLELFEVSKLQCCLQEIARPARTLLLLLVDSQERPGTIIFDGMPDTLLCKVSRHLDAGAAYSVKRPPYVVAYHAALRNALALAARGEVPHDAVRLPSLVPLLQANNGYVRHVCLQEDLREPWSHDPHQPPPFTLHRVVDEQDISKKSIIAEMMQAHLEALFE